MMMLALLLVHVLLLALLLVLTLCLSLSIHSEPASEPETEAERKGAIAALVNRLALAGQVHIRIHAVNSLSKSLLFILKRGRSSPSTRCTSAPGRLPTAARRGRTGGSRRARRGWGWATRGASSSRRRCPRRGARSRWTSGGGWEGVSTGRGRKRMNLTSSVYTHVMLIHSAWAFVECSSSRQS